MKPGSNPYEKMLAEGRTSLRPENIKAYGVQRFLAKQVKRGPLQLPKLHFMDEESRLMDELVAEEARLTQVGH
ncbi:MAG: hypothetical protein EOO56_12580 [Hymenobacter sp.]|nr:MAG: hypothetical protein EOO56_12580 [Hymenobacter sp.]